LRDEAHVGQLQMPDQRREVAGEVPRVRAARNLAPWRVAAMREGHARVATGEKRDLLPPGQMIAADSMGKDDRGTRSRHFIIDAAPWSVEKATPRSRGSSGLRKGGRQK
jgi:hypothetical protein